MAFMGKRQGFNVSRHLQWKSSDKLRAKIRQMGRNDGFKTLGETQTKVFNVIHGILARRGERID